LGHSVFRFLEELTMVAVNSVEAIPDFVLLLTFNSGEQRRFDMRPYLHYPVFCRLKNPGFFCELGDKPPIPANPASTSRVD
jgi:hypothetical protein